MSIRKVNLVSGEYYHIYNRGNSKQKIFLDNEDYFRFMSLLYACNSKNNFRIFMLMKDESPYDFERGKEIVSIGAYCLMPNHFHILLTQTEDENISKFMQKLTTAYAMYYNRKYKHTGGLFEGKFKSKHAKDDRDLIPAGSAAGASWITVCSSNFSCLTPFLLSLRSSQY